MADDSTLVQLTPKARAALTLIWEREAIGNSTAVNPALQSYGDVIAAQPSGTRLAIADQDGGNGSVPWIE